MNDDGRSPLGNVIETCYICEQGDMRRCRVKTDGDAAVRLMVCDHCSVELANESDADMNFVIHEEANRVGRTSIRLPTNADEAAAMALVGSNWLEQNSPERLKPRTPVCWQYRTSPTNVWHNCNAEALDWWKARGDNVETRVLYDR